MKPGDLFSADVSDFEPGAVSGRHLYVVLSFPMEEQRLLMVATISTYESYKDQTTLLTSRDHPNISHESVVMYDRVRLVPMQRIDALIKEKRIVVHQPFSPEVMKRIHSGAAKSRKIKYRYIQMLDRLRLLDD